jgi:uncharacterized protein
MAIEQAGYRFVAGSSTTLEIAFDTQLPVLIRRRRKHNAFFVNLNDRESEALLLILFINAAHEGPSATMINAWRRGDVETLNRILRESFQDFPSLARRLIDTRNQNWLPKIDGYLRSGQTYFVVVGAGHLGGPNGLLGLLKARGCKLEEL